MIKIVTFHWSHIYKMPILLLFNRINSFNFTLIIKNISEKHNTDKFLTYGEKIDLSVF